ncbi:uncharacterized protein LOC103184848 [Callorhinchus milii]|uniref:uncharacterized protein LOC103184848 n=1 Tax=Callorhinchus milii TaxID=7868 RepID=UPI001C3FDB9F|nr:uncharacterized protein LOC103184848 [Callorhinchus milii]
MSMLKMLKIIGIYVLFGLSFETQQIEGVMNVTAVKGYEAILQCEAPGKSSNKPVQFQVNKEDNNTMIAIYNPPVNKILNSSYKLRATLEVTENSVTIIIKEAQESDKGWYSCQVHSFPGGKVVQKIYLDIKDDKDIWNHLHMTSLITYLSVSIAGAVAVAVILAMVIWKVKKKTLPKNKQIPYNDDPIYANCDYTPHKIARYGNYTRKLENSKCDATKERRDKSTIYRPVSIIGGKLLEPIIRDILTEHLDKFAQRRENQHGL